jgi:hypothetical protein
MLSVFLLCELTVRLFFSVEVSPRVMLYGTDWYRNSVPDDQESRHRRAATDERLRSETEAHLSLEAREDSVERHDNVQGEYSKFFPHEYKTTRDVDTGERIVTTINGAGFRGKDFSVEKAAGVVRIVTLGASSTFGFYNRDEDTYPVRLQGVLESRCPHVSFEVVNLGIPHLSSDMIAALYLAEGTRLSPDAVTFYEGRNDTVLDERYGEGAFARIRSAVVHRLLLAAFVDQALFGSRESVTSAGMAFEPYARARSDLFLGNLERIRASTESSGTFFILANQQAAASPGGPVSGIERMARQGITLASEADEIRRRFEAGEEIYSFEYSLLVHERLMRDAEAWAARRNVAFADVIAALDRDRHLLLSWVHLHPDANAVVAETLAVPLLQRFCRDVAARRRSDSGLRRRLGGKSDDNSHSWLNPFVRFRRSTTWSKDSARSSAASGSRAIGAPFS